MRRERRGNKFGEEDQIWNNGVGTLYIPVTNLSASGLDAPNFPGAEARDFFPSEMMEVAEDLEGVGEAARPDLRELVLPTCKDDFT